MSLSYGAFPAPEVFHHVEPQALADYFELIRGDCRYRAPIDQEMPEKWDLISIEKDRKARAAAMSILEPVRTDLQEQLGWGKDSLDYRGIDFERTVAQPGQSHSSIVRWHSDGDTDGLLTVRVDERDGSEHLAGDIPEAVVRAYCEEYDLPIDAPVDFEMLGEYLESNESSASEINGWLREHGVTWVQPDENSAYLLRGHHLHRSPTNLTQEPITRNSFIVTFMTN